MNGRIQELIEQASETSTSYFDGRGNITETYFDKEKFAELIVKECSAFINHFSDGHEKDQFGRNLYHYTNDIGQVILEHFGVEK